MLRFSLYHVILQNFLGFKTREVSLFELFANYLVDFVEPVVKRVRNQYIIELLLKDVQLIHQHKEMI